jgi:hypothetical protein
MKRIVYTQAEGGAAVIIPAPKYLSQLMSDRQALSEGGKTITIKGMSEADALAHIAAKDVPEGVQHAVVDSASLPQDRYFRKAWRFDGAGVAVDMPQARTVHMDNIRSKRDEKLKELDIEQLKGVDVSAQKQVLRDIPQTFDLTGAATPDELKTLWPPEVPR